MFLLNSGLDECLNDEPEILSYFNSLPMGHRNYFNNYINSAKTPETIAKRINMIIKALSKKQDFGEMIRQGKSATII